MTVAAHTGLAYQTVEEFLASAVPYVKRGVTAGEAVIAATTQANINALRGALGPDAETVEFVRSNEWYESPVRSFSKYQRYWREKERSGAHALRILGEPIDERSGNDDLERWTAFENATNALLGNMPVRMMCPYDLRNPLVNRSCVEVSHPHLAQGAGFVRSANYVEARAYASSRYATPLTIPTSGVRGRAFDKEALVEVRALLHRVGDEMGFDAAGIIDLIIAVGEATANAVEHGGGSGILRTWRSNGEVICDVVSSGGHIADPMRGYSLPPVGGDRGRGMWVMRQLCDWVDVRAQGDGSVVRLHMRVPSKAEPPN